MLLSDSGGPLFGGGFYGRLVGKQTVPRAELRAIVEVLRRIDGDIVVPTDHENLVKTFNKGYVPTLASHAASLWVDFWQAFLVRWGTVTLVWVPFHQSM